MKTRRKSGVLAPLPGPGDGDRFMAARAELMAETSSAPLSVANSVLGESMIVSRPWAADDADAVPK